METTLIHSYTIREVSAEEWYAVFSEHVEEVFPDEHGIINLEALLDKDDSEKLAALGARMSGSYQLYCLVMDGDTPVGWHYGFQRSSLEYFMANTAVLPAHQNKGIYTALIKHIIRRATAEGFQYITSIHHSDNNAVLVPKLKAGFIIQAFGNLIQTMILEANYGPMVQLVYPLKDEYRRLFNHRTGQAAMNAAMKDAG